MSLTCTTCACCKTSAHRVPCVSSLRWLRPPATTPKHEAKPQSMEHLMKQCGKQRMDQFMKQTLWCVSLHNCYIRLSVALHHNIIHIIGFRIAL